MSTSSHPPGGATSPLLGGADYLAPRQVLTGAGSARLVGESLRAYGAAAGPAFVVADPVLRIGTLLDGLLDGLRASGLEPVLFSGAGGEPTLEELGAAADQARRTRAVAVVGVGGGSPMDLAKLVALAVTNDGDPGDWVGQIVPPRPLAPLALVPTTVGTGSEVTRIAMVSAGHRKQIASCVQFVPLVAALDPDLVATLPGPVVAATGMDALAHALESLFSRNRNALTIAAATQAVPLLLDHIEPAAAGDREALSAMLVGAHYAGLALNAGVVVGHSLAYVIARRAHLAHGVTCALALPYCLAYNRHATDGTPEEVARVATAGQSADLRVAVDAVDQLVERLGLPRSLAAVGIAASDSAAMAEECVRDYPRPTNPVSLDRHRLTELISAMQVGSLDRAWLA